jgi:hypothetical protein
MLEQSFQQVEKCTVASYAITWGTTARYHDKKEARHLLQARACSALNPVGAKPGGLAVAARHEHAGCKIGSKKEVPGTKRTALIKSNRMQPLVGSATNIRHPA